MKNGRETEHRMSMRGIDWVRAACGACALCGSYPRQLETVVVFGMPFGIPRESMKSAVASPMTPAKSAS